MRRLAVIVGLTLALAGCGDFFDQEPSVYEMKLDDGRTVTCVKGPSRRSGIDCDWEHAR